MLPPFHCKGLPDDGLFDCCARVIHAVASPHLRVLLHHNPAVSGVGIGPALIERLPRRFPGTVAGIKDSAGNWTDTEATNGRLPGFAVFPGSELALVRALRAGAVGCISATANVQPAPIAAVVADPRGPEAEARQARLDAVRSAVQTRPLIPAPKAVLAAAPGDPGWALVGPPFNPLPEGDATAPLRELAELGFALPGGATRPGLAQGQGQASRRMPSPG